MIAIVAIALAMVVLGYEDTLQVTVDDLAHHTAAVARTQAPTLMVAPVHDVQVNPDRVRELARLTRDLVIVKIDPSRANDPEIAAEGERDRRLGVAAQFSTEDLMRAFDLLTKAEFDIRGSAHPRYHLEMALLRWIHLRKLVPLPLGHQHVIDLTPPRDLTLEESLEFAREDECVEVTPESIRIRKVILDQNVLLLQATNNAELQSRLAYQARMDFLPTVNFSSGGNRGSGFAQDQGGRNIAFSNTNLNGNLSAGINVFNGFADVASLRQARYSEDASEFTLERARQNVVFNVATTFVALINAQEQIRIQQENVETQQQQLAHGRDLDQLLGDVADAVLEARLAALPGGAAETVEHHAPLLRAVARQQLDVLHRQVQLVARLHVERLVPLVHVADRAVDAEIRRAVRIGKHQRAQRLVANLGPPHLRPRQEETLVAGEAAEHRRLLGDGPRDRLAVDHTTAGD